MTEENTTRVLGYTFEPMDTDDWYAFAGADEGSLICYAIDGATLILSPDGNLHEIRDDGSEYQWSCRSL